MCKNTNNTNSQFILKTKNKFEYPNYSFLKAIKTNQIIKIVIILKLNQYKFNLWLIRPFPIK